MNKKNKAVKAELEKATTGSKISLIIGIVLCAILVPILIINCALIVVGIVNPGKPPSLFGYTPMIVLSPSMDPLFAEGDMIIVQTVDPATVNEGDVITFFDPASTSDSVLTHRVIDIYEKDGKRYAVTAGDFNANNDYEQDLRIAAADKVDPNAKKEEVLNKATIVEDPKKPGYEYVIYEPHSDAKAVELNEKNLIGCYIYQRVPFVGKVSMFMQTTWGWIICIAVPLIALLAYELITRKKKDKSKNQDMDALLAELEALKAAKAAADAGAVVDEPAENTDAAQAADTPTDDANDASDGE